MDGKLIENSSNHFLNFLVSNNHKNLEEISAAKKREEKEKIRNMKKKKQKKIKEKEKKKLGKVEESFNGIAIEKNYEDVSKNENVEIEYIEGDEYLLTGKYYEEFKNVFQYFSTPKLPNENQATKEEEEDDDDDKPQFEKKKHLKKKEIDNSKPLSKKKRKHLQQLKIAQLKAYAKRPDVVEAWDVTSPDPLCLVFLKSYKNTVPVPRHWCQKRKFLQNKRGILKTPFQLPDAIEATGIAKLRDPFDRNGARMVRQKLRERMNPKLGKLDIDYEVLHDAFFKFNKKPKMTVHGDIYYEGKENEVKMRSFKPGKLTDDLRQALGISEYAPPPWIINMQRYGPPPSYPNLKIPGLTAPLNESYGGGYFYGRPFDEDGKPILTGGLFGAPIIENGIQLVEEENAIVEQNIFWGEIVEDEGEYMDEPTLIDNVNMKNDTMSNTSIPDFIKMNPEIRDSTKEESGISSVVSGMETPEIDIRKQKQAGANIFGSSHGYVIPESGQNPPQNNPIIPGQINLANSDPKKLLDSINFKF